MTPATLHAVVALFMVALGATPDATDFAGRWKLVTTSPVSEESFIVDLKAEQGKLAASVVDPPSLLRGQVPPRAYCEFNGDAIVVLVTNYQGDYLFKGTRRGGNAVDRIPGAFQFGMLAASTAYVAEGRLERTQDDHVAKPKPADAKDADSSGIFALLSRAKPVAELRQERYRRLDLKIAVAAESGLSFNADTGTRAWSATRLTEAAERAGEHDLAVEAKARRDKLKAMFAQEERPQVGPLAVEPFTGPRPADHDRVVLMEMFLSVEEPNSIREGLAFDALTSAYKPTELIAIQYHLNLPSPDPMASPDSVARGKSYGVDRTPYTLLDGKRLPRSSPIDEAARKFNQYRRLIDEAMKGKRRAAIALRVDRDGDTLQLSASAEIADGAKRAERARLRLVLTEDDVPYVSKVGLSHYQRVVRAMPGGVAGVACRDRHARLDAVVKLGRLRDNLQRDLRDGPREPGPRGEFRGGVPPILLKRLSLIAFVQDDEGSVIHAVIVPVPESDGVTLSSPPK